MMPPLTPVVRALLFANVGIYALETLVIGTRTLDALFGLWPLAAEGSLLAHPGYNGPQFWPWQLLTYGFLHGGIAHLFFNMFALWMFGAALERLWGKTHFLVYYFFCLAGAGVVQLFVTTSALSQGGFPVPTIGASGAVFGLLLAFGMMFPNVKLLLLFLPVPIKAKYFVVLYGILELTLGVTNTQSTVAHFAHLGGMLFGIILIQYWRGKLPWKPRLILRM